MGRPGADDPGGRPTRTAAGFVLLRTREDDAVEYLLLTNRERGEPGFPKGHADPGESVLATALRETAEETGLADLEVHQAFRRELVYGAERQGVAYRKVVVYHLARARSGAVTLSPEHARSAWLPYAEARAALPHETLRHVLREAALWWKDPAVARAAPATETEALALLRAQPDLTAHLEAHLRGGAQAARALATALARRGVAVDPESAAVATVLHDIGRARGAHADHPRAGLAYLRTTRFAPYAAACWTHFSKGAPPEDLVAAGVNARTVEEVGGWIDPVRLTWEERCAAVADACMKGDRRVTPDERFADLHARYDTHALIDLQQERVRDLLATLHDALGGDPLAVLDLA